MPELEKHEHQQPELARIADYADRIADDKIKGAKATHSLPLTPGYGRIINRPKRIHFRIEEVVILGPVNFEPGMLRVRRPDGSVFRALREHLELIEEQ